MGLKVLYFAVLRERCGVDEEDLPLPQPPDVRALKEALQTRHPFLAGRWPNIRVAVNQEFAGDEMALHEGDEVALIPPVAGGAQGEPRVRLQDTPLSMDQACAQVMGPGQGGLCVFAGAVRNHAHGQTVNAIDYSAYGPMALRQMEDIVARAEARWQAQVACHHRVGHLQVGELAVVIAAAAPHRDEAFGACRQVIEELKQDVPIWKKEYGADGVSWVGMGP